MLWSLEILQLFIVIVWMKRYVWKIHCPKLKKHLFISFSHNRSCLKNFWGLKSPLQCGAPICQLQKPERGIFLFETLTSNYTCSRYQRSILPLPSWKWKVQKQILQGNIEPALERTIRFEILCGYANGVRGERLWPRHKEGWIHGQVNTQLR